MIDDICDEVKLGGAAEEALSQLGCAGEQILCEGGKSPRYQYLSGLKNQRSIPDQCSDTA